MIDKKEVYKRILNLAYDVNPAEIASHIKKDSLREWCHSWTTKMIDAASLILLLSDELQLSDKGEQT